MRRILLSFSLLVVALPAAAQQAAPVRLDRPAPAPSAGSGNTIALEGGQPSGGLPASYASGRMPFIYTISYMNFNSWYTSLDHDMDCVSEIKNQYGIAPGQTGPWLWRKHMSETYVPEEDETPHPVATLIYCSPKKVAVEISSVNLGGSSYFDIEAAVLPIPSGQDAEAACAAKAARLPQVEPRLAPRPFVNSLQIYNSEVFEDAKTNLAFVVSCTDVGEVVLAVVGTNGRKENLQALKDAWNRL
jgi:hypothetical protein